MNEAEILREIVGNKKVYCKVCTVDKVDEFTCNVTPLLDKDAPIIAVRLKAHIQGDNGIIIKPKVGSFVLVAFLTRLDAFVVMNDEIDQITIKIDNTSLLMDKDSIKMNDGSYDGLVKIQDLVKKLNNLENIVNDLITQYNSHTHPGVQAGSGTTSPTSMLENNQLTTTQQSDLENKKITHG
jgi:hypothetical protein